MITEIFILVSIYLAGRFGYMTITSTDMKACEALCCFIPSVLFVALMYPTVMHIKTPCLVQNVTVTNDVDMKFVDATHPHLSVNFKFGKSYCHGPSCYDFIVANASGYCCKDEKLGHVRSYLIVKAWYKSTYTDDVVSDTYKCDGNSHVCAKRVTSLMANRTICKTDKVYGGLFINPLGSQYKLEFL